MILGLKEKKCEECGISDTWNGKPLNFELHHIDGDHYNNELSNLQILCPNCHSQTDSYKRRHSIRKGKLKPNVLSKKTIECVCECCGKSFIADRKGRRFCSRECYNNYLKKLTYSEGIITKEALLNVLDEFESFVELAKYFNISSTGIKNYLKKYDLFEIAKERYKKSDCTGTPVMQCDLKR